MVQDFFHRQWHLKIDACKMNFSFWVPFGLFSGANLLLVSGRVHAEKGGRFLGVSFFPCHEMNCVKDTWKSSFLDDPYRKDSLLAGGNAYARLESMQNNWWSWYSIPALSYLSLTVSSNC